MRLRALRSLFLVLAVGLVVGVMALSSLGMAPASRTASSTSSSTPLPPLVTTTTVNNATATYGDATVVLTASVTATIKRVPYGITGGGFTFTVRTLNGFPVGKSVSAKVQSGFASGTLTLPSNEKIGSYVIYGSYAGYSSDFAPSNNQGTLTIIPCKLDDDRGQRDGVGWRHQCPVERDDCDGLRSAD